MRATFPSSQCAGLEIRHLWPKLALACDGPSTRLIIPQRRDLRGAGTLPLQLLPSRALKMF